MRWLLCLLLLAGFTAGFCRAAVLEPAPDKRPLSLWEISVETLQTVGVDDSGSDYFATWLHLSNGNMSEPRKENIGVDSFGVVAGAGWAF